MIIKPIMAPIILPRALVTASELPPDVTNWKPAMIIINTATAPAIKAIKLAAAPISLAAGLLLSFGFSHTELLAPSPEHRSAHSLFLPVSALHTFLGKRLNAETVPTGTAATVSKSVLHRTISNFLIQATRPITKLTIVAARATTIIPTSI